MPIEAVKIPQNVQVEDKVVGPLSLRQLIIIAIGAGFSYLIYSTVQHAIQTVSIPLTVVIWLPAVIATAFAVVSINDLSLIRIVFLLLERTQKPGKRIWAPRQGISIVIHTSKLPQKEEVKKVSTEQKKSRTEQIEALTAVVDDAVPSVMALPQQKPSEIFPEEKSFGAEPVKMTTEQTPMQKRPVDPSRVRVDQTSPKKAELSDLSVFRDIFPPTAQWQ